MQTKLFFIGLFLYLVSFSMPVADGFMGTKHYGYEIALMPFDGSDFEPIDILLLVTNATVAITCIAYAIYLSGIVSALSVLGSGVAVYWVVLSLSDQNPWATIVWASGSILITVGYEVKRRRINN